MLEILNLCPDMSITNFFSIHFENKRKILAKLKSLESVFSQFFLNFQQKLSKILSKPQLNFACALDKGSLVSVNVQFFFPILSGQLAFFN
jgi:hypothetical protein